jgi:hypothetical protein
MSYRAPAVALFTLFLATWAAALPPKRVHYDKPSIDSEGFFEPSESPRPRPDTISPDPLELARQLACEPLVIRGFVKAWKATLNGTRNQGMAETGFAIQSYKASISIQGWIESNVNDLLIPTDGYTVAIAHVHGRGANEHPAFIDQHSPVPNFVISQTALYVTVPGSTRTIRVRGGVIDTDGWSKPCSVKELSITAQW